MITATVLIVLLTAGALLAAHRRRHGSRPPVVIDRSLENAREALARMFVPRP